jgi:post-segregation antitoxin (ccd killing protein)
MGSYRREEEAMKTRRPTQVSVRGEVYDRLKCAAAVRGVKISHLVEAAVEDELAQAARTVDPPRTGG